MFHEFDGSCYAIASTHQREWGNRMITELGLKGDESVLDLGCGDGALTAQLAERVPDGKVVGVDASIGMLAAAQQYSAANLTFIHQDINRIDFDQQFDVVFSNAALHWVKDHRLLYAKVRRALRPHGRIRFNFAGAGNCATFFGVVHHAMSAELFSHYFEKFEWPWYMPELEEYRTITDAAGLEQAELWSENADRYFADEDAMIRWLDQPSLVPFLAHLPEQVSGEFRDYVIDKMVVLARQHDGRYFETFRRINVAATL